VSFDLVVRHLLLTSSLAGSLERWSVCMNVVGARWVVEDGPSMLAPDWPLVPPRVAPGGEFGCLNTITIK